MAGEQEKEILELCRKHMDRVLKTVEVMRDAVHFFCNLEEEKLKAAADGAAKAERKADREKAKIIEKLSRGPIHPIDREEIIRLVLNTDDVAENARAAARKLVLLSPEEFCNELGDDLRSFSDLALEIAVQLKNAFGTLLENPKKAIDEANKVEKMEEKIDVFRAKHISVEIIDWADRSKKPGTSLILKEVTDNMEDVADRSEDVADVIRSIAIASV